MHLLSSVHPRKDRNEATTPRHAIGVRKWALPLGLFVVLCLRHVVACVV
jgi:hypothetical protein